MSPRRGAVGVVLALAALAAVAGLLSWAIWRSDKAVDPLARRVAARVAVSADKARPCAPSPTPAVLLWVLGQSNAGNHGAAPALPAGADRVQLLGPQGCIEVAEPLPGATGQGASLWPRVQREWQRRGHVRPLRFAVLAVDATSMAEWTRHDGALQRALQRQVHDMRLQGVQPDLVLWQQGEADARAGTSSPAYEAGLYTLLTQWRGMGVRAPVLLARSTHCRQGDGQAVRQAQDRLLQRLPDVAIGPDLDRLQGAARVDGCHFSAAGLDAAAALWVDALESALALRPSRPGSGGGSGA